MKAAQTLVWVMSGLIVVLLGVLVVGLSLGWHKEEETTVEISAETTFETLVLNQPPGTVIESMEEIEGRLAISLSNGGRPPRIILVDPRSGRILGKILLEEPGPAVP